MRSSISLGEITAPILVFGGPYSNLAATKAIQAEAERLTIPPERVICTGDVVAYCADPVATTDLIRAWGISLVMGNCEESLAENSPDCGCGFEEGSSCSLLSVGWYNYANQVVTLSQRRWMSELPRNLSFSLNGLKFLVIHGGVERINEFIFRSTSDEVKAQQLEKSGVDVIIGGHCGIPFGQALRNGHWLNAGVIGMPANDATPDGWYMLLSPARGHVEVTWHRLRYSATHSRQSMLKAGLNKEYADALTTGLWPSTDVLPDSEKESTAQTIVLQGYDIS